MVPIKNDINILENYKFQESDNWKDSRYNRKNNKTLLGVKNGRLVEVNSKDVTCGNLFLRIFGKGRLANT